MGNMKFSNYKQSPFNLILIENFKNKVEKHPKKYKVFFTEQSVCLLTKTILAIHVFHSWIPLLLTFSKNFAKT